jgi:hypothetical protein
MVEMLQFFNCSRMCNYIPDPCTARPYIFEKFLQQQYSDCLLPGLSMKEDQQIQYKLHQQAPYIFYCTHSQIPEQMIFNISANGIVWIAYIHHSCMSSIADIMPQDQVFYQWQQEFV